jgi:two-component system sporulation sensor kinase C
MEIVFSDTGSGISKENLGKVFEPLFSTKTKGTGLGLSVCASLVEGHNGKIEVVSEVGKGTTFTIKLPINRG